jgi:uncharacterized protein
MSPDSGYVPRRPRVSVVCRAGKPGLAGAMGVWYGVSKMLEFKALTIEDKPRVDAAFEANPPEVSELTFTNLFCWLAKRRVSVAQDGGALALLCEEDDRRFFLPPACMCDAAGAVGRMFEYARAQGFAPEVERVPEEMATELGKAGFRVAEDRDNFDYVYAVEDLALLEGGNHDGKRNSIKQALAKYACEYRRITAANVADCLALETTWCNLRQCDADPGLAAEQRAIGACFANWERFGLIGGAITVEGRIEAFAIAEQLNPVTAVVHFEKANPELRGLYQLINQWFCKNELLEYKFVNREQDLGIAGLRQAKESYHPHHMVRKFIVRPASD